MKTRIFQTFRTFDALIPCSRVAFYFEDEHGIFIGPFSTQEDAEIASDLHQQSSDFNNQEI